ncbi:MAG: hypothetical protein Fur0032_08190 [Terrimicrobiaceae bacterium]
MGAGEASDAYLMTGFDQKSLHVSSTDAPRAKVTIEVDFLGDGHFHRYTTLELADGFAHHSFPYGFSAHWVRLVSDTDGTMSAQFHYN